MESDLDHPAIRASARSLEEHFRGARKGPLPPLRNPHHEPKVDVALEGSAVPAAVLIPIVSYEAGLALLLTRRHHSISSPGHIAFPGGRADETDSTAEETALREAEEEIALARSKVRVLGRLGDYYSHSGFRIAPVVGLVAPPLRLTPRPGEVEEILEIPLSFALDPSSYQLRRSPSEEPRAYFILDHQGVVVAGPTVSLLIGLYEELLKTHRKPDFQAAPVS